MGMFDKVLGNAQEVSASDGKAIVGPILLEGELISYASLVGVRDMFIMTERRMIIVDKTGLSGKKMHITSIPWKNVLSWTMTTAGTIDIDSELTIHVRGNQMPLMLKFPKRTNLGSVTKMISQLVFA